jgi:hypothetical protein
VEKNPRDRLLNKARKESRATEIKPRMGTGVHLISASAFYSLASANRARIGALTKITNSGYIKSQLPQLWGVAMDSLMNNKSEMLMRKVKQVYRPS